MNNVDLWLDVLENWFDDTPEPEEEQEPIKTGTVIVTEYDYDDWTATIEKFPAENYDIDGLEIGETEKIKYSTPWNETVEKYTRIT